MFSYSVRALFTTVLVLAAERQAMPQQAEPLPKIPLGITVIEAGSPGSRSVVVWEVTPREIGYRLGLVKGDTIVAVNGHRVDSRKRLGELIRTETATVYWKDKDGLYYKNTVTTAARPNPGAHSGATVVDDFAKGKSLTELEKNSDAAPGAAP